MAIGPGAKERQTEDRFARYARAAIGGPADTEELPPADALVQTSVERSGHRMGSPRAAHLAQRF